MCAKIHPDLLGKLSAYQGSLFGSWAGNRCYVGWKIVPWTLLDDISPLHAKMAGTDLFFFLSSVYVCPTSIASQATLPMDAYAAICVAARSIPWGSVQTDASSSGDIGASLNAPLHSSLVRL